MQYSPKFYHVDFGNTLQETSTTDSADLDIVAESSPISDLASTIIHDNDAIPPAPRLTTSEIINEVPCTSMDEKIDGSPQRFNYEFLGSIVDPRPIFLPLSIKRVLWLASCFAAISGLTYLGWSNDAISKFRAYAAERIIPLMVFLFGYEPVMLALYMFISRYPSTIEYAPEEHNDVIISPYWRVLEPLPSRNPLLAIIIPCHNSGKFIAETVISCLRHVSPTQIFIMDNGKGESPSDNTRDAVHAIHPRINYFYLPKTGNKTIALLLGAQYVKKNFNNLTEVLIIDDDTHIPIEFSVRREFFNDPTVKGIVYPIRAASPYNKEPLLSRHQDIEYKIADLEMAFLDRTKSVMRPHGAASLWLIDALIPVLLKHNAIWGGEDVLMGMILKYLHFDEGVGKLRLDLRCYFKTTVPQTYFGNQLNFYQQRVRSWNEAQYVYPWNLIFRPLFTGWRRSPLSLLSTKNSQLYNLYTQLVYIARYPIIAVLAEQPFFWEIFAGTKVLELLMTLSFNYLKLPGYLRSDLVAVCTYPLYKEASACLGALSFLRALFISGPDAAHPRSLKHRIEHHRIELPVAAPDPEPADIDTALNNDENFSNVGTQLTETFQLTNVFSQLEEQPSLRSQETLRSLSEMSGTNGENINTIIQQQPIRIAQEDVSRLSSLDPESSSMSTQRLSPDLLDSSTHGDEADQRNKKSTSAAATPLASKSREYLAHRPAAFFYAPNSFVSRLKCNFDDSGNIPRTRELKFDPTLYSGIQTTL